MLPAVALLELPIVTNVQERAANEAPLRGLPIERPQGLSMWHVFEALQDAADETGATSEEADAFVAAAFFEVQHSIVPGVPDDVG